MSWPLEDFQRVGYSLIDTVRALGSGFFQFELMDAGQSLVRPLVSTDTTRTETVTGMIEYLVNATGVTIQYSGVDTARLGWGVAYTMSSTTTALELLKLMGVSINARVSVDPAGNVTLVSFDPSAAIPLGVDEIGTRRLSVTEVIGPYATVTLIRSDDTEVSDATGVLAGSLEQTIRLQTCLSVVGEANTLLAEYVSYYANAHPVYQIPIVGLTQPLTTGAAMTITHPELNSTGMITLLARSPLTNAADIELEIQ